MSGLQQRAVYARISDDAKRIKLGIGGRNVSEQVDDGLSYVFATWGIDPSEAVEHGAPGWETAPVVVYRENDRSAYKRQKTDALDPVTGERFTTYRVRRPVWAQMMNDTRTGRYRDIIGLDMDRYLRDPFDLEDAVNLAEHDGVRWHETTSGDMRLHTSDGQFMARVRASMLRNSSDDTRRRVKRAHQRRIGDGVPNWGHRPFGHVVIRDDKGRALRAEVVEEEAAEIVAAAKKILRGVTIGEIARDWEARGIKTPEGGSWLGPADRIYRNPKTGKNTAPGAGSLVGQMFRKARVAGLLEHHGDIIGPSEFIPPILDRAVWEAVVATMNNRSSAGRGLAPGFAADRQGAVLLTGKGSPARCGECGSVLTTKMQPSKTGGDPTRMYRCVRGCVFVSMEIVDQEVLDRAAVAAAQHGISILPGADAIDTAPLKAREAELVREMAGWQQDVLARRVTREFALPVINGLERDVAQVRAEIAKAEATVATRPEALMKVIREWGAMPIGERRAIVSRLYASIRIYKRSDRTSYPGFRVTTRFADWLPAGSVIAGVDIQGLSNGVAPGGDLAGGTWLIDGEWVKPKVATTA